MEEENETEGLDTHIRFPEKLYDRDQELQTLLSLYELSCRDHPTDSEAEAASQQNGRKKKAPKTGDTPLAFIAGYSGVGKSRLIETLVEQIHAKARKPNSKVKPCYFLRGKFDQYSSGVSYSAIVEAFTGFCSQILQGDAAELERFKNSIIAAVGEEAKLITDVVPGLERVIGEQKLEVVTDNYNREKEWHRLRYIFGNFVRAICSEDRPVLLFLDDLQWIDSASLKLLEEIVTDDDLEHIMFVASYRSNEVGTDHPLSLLMKTVAERRQLEKINLDSLSADAVEEFIADSLRLELEECTNLADVLHRKTHGNIFFIKQSLEYLSRKGLLYKSLVTFQWTWDIQQVETMADLSDNVVELVTSKVVTLPQDLQVALSIASFLRSTFDVETLLSLMKSEGHSLSLKHLVRLLKDAVAEELLVAIDIGFEHFKFAHDRIQQACHTLIPPGEAHDSLRMRIAKILIHRGNSSEGEDWMLFVAADHLNSLPKTDLLPIEAAQLNLQVGEKAVSVAAFRPACGYLLKALEAFDRVENGWRIHYDMAINLHRAAADVELSFGSLERGTELCNILIARTQSLEDKLRIKLSLGQALGRLQRHSEALDVHVEALQSINEWPRSFFLFQVLRDLRSVMQYLKKHSDEEIYALPPLDDPIRIVALDHFSDLATRAFYCGKIELVLLCALKQLKMSMTYGTGPHFAEALVTFSLILSENFNDFEGAKRMGRLGRHILASAKGMDRIRAKNRECFILTNIGIFM